MIVLLFAGSLFGRNDTAPGPSTKAGSSYSTVEGGLSGIYTALAAEGLARRWELPPHRLPAEVDRLVLWEPEALTTDDWTDLLGWVRAGHTLIMAGESEHFPGTRKLADAGRARSASAHPATIGVREVAVGATVFNTLEGFPLRHLVREDDTPVLVSWPEGSGRVFWSADLGWLSNDRILAADNLALAIQLLTPRPSGQVAFDEYHHGFQQVERWWQILRGNLQTVTLQLIGTLLLFYWAAGVRFGAPRLQPEEPPRAAAEYVYSMSQLYRRAGAGRLAAGAIYRGLVRDLGRLTGGALGLSHSEIARRSAQAAGLPPEELAGLLDSLDPARARPWRDQELIALAAQAEEIRRRVRHAGYRDQHNA